MESHKIIQVDEKVPLKLLLPLSIQHMFAMFGASVRVPVSYTHLDVYKRQVGNVIIKCGKRGCYIRTDVEKCWIAAEENVNCIDTTGAGDSFAAGFLNALLDGKGVKRCAKEGNRYGAEAVQHIGATAWLNGGL